MWFESERSLCNISRKQVNPLGTIRGQNDPVTFSHDNPYKTLIGPSIVMRCRLLCYQQTCSS